MELLEKMFKENTGKDMLDSGGAYGRNWQRNQDRDFSKIPQATLKIDKWGPEITVSSYQHCLACLELDDVCNAFNALPVDDWHAGHGLSTRGHEFLVQIGAEIEDAWNSCNWDNNFDQVMEGHKVDINGVEYVLLQIHGGCDVRGGYTDAKLFRIQDWMEDYWMLDDSSFWIEDQELSIDVQACRMELYNPNTQDQEDIPEDFWETIPHQTIEGVQCAVEH